MNLNEVFAITPSIQQRIDEAPYGLGARATDTVLGAIGNKEARGNKEAGKKANEMMKEFKQYVGRILGRGKTSIPSAVLVQFLQAKRIDTNHIDIPSSDITPKDAERIMFDAARQTFLRGDPSVLDQGKTPIQPQTGLNKSKSKKQSKPNSAENNKVSSALKMIQTLSDEELQELLKQL